MENSDNEDDGNLDNLEDLDEEQMEKLLQLQVCVMSSVHCPLYISQSPYNLHFHLLTNNEFRG